MVGGAGLAPAGPKAPVLQTGPLLVTDYPPIYTYAEHPIGTLSPQTGSHPGGCFGIRTQYH